MRVKTVRLREFKRFDDLTIDLGPTPKKIIALVGPNGCGKSSIFDAFEQQMQTFRSRSPEEPWFYSKSLFYHDEHRNTQYRPDRSVNVTFDSGSLNRKSFYIRTSYRFTPRLDVREMTAVPSILQLKDEPKSTIALDGRLNSNYKRLLATSYEEFDEGSKTGDQVRSELLGKVTPTFLATFLMWKSRL